MRASILAGVVAAGFIAGVEEVGSKFEVASRA
jgi:hypothetical protein